MLFFSQKLYLNTSNEQGPWSDDSTTRLLQMIFYREKFDGIFNIIAQLMLDVQKVCLNKLTKSFRFMRGARSF